MIHENVKGMKSKAIVDNIAMVGKSLGIWGRGLWTKIFLISYSFLEVLTKSDFGIPWRGGALYGES